MPQQLDYHRPENAPDEGFNWRDVRPAVWFQFGSIVTCLIMPYFLIFIVPAIVIYWVVTAIIAARGIRRSVYGWDQVFVRWGYPITVLALFGLLTILTLCIRW